MDHLTPEQLLDFADERLAQDEARAVSAHLASCAACRTELASLQRVAAILAEDEWIMPPHSARSAVQQAYRRQYAGSPQERSALQGIAGWLRGLLAPGWQPVLALALVLIIAAAFLLLRESPGAVYAASASAVSGTVERQPLGSANWNPVQEGNTLQRGEQLRTGADGTLLLTYPDGSSTTVQANSLLALGELQEEPRTITYELRRGESYNHVVASADPTARFEITTPTATVTSPGGDFRVVVDTLGTALVQVDEGELTITAAGRELALRAGQEAVAAADQPPRLLSDETTPTPSPTPIEAAPTATPQPTATVAPPATETPSLPAPIEPPDDDDDGDDDVGEGDLDDDGPVDDTTDDGDDDDDDNGDDDNGDDDNGDDVDDDDSGDG